MEIYNEKCQTILKILNMILKSIDKEEIKELTEFKEVLREDIEKNSKISEEMNDEILKSFKKKECGLHRKDSVKKFIFTLLREMCSNIGYEFRSKKKDKRVTIDNVNYRRTYMIYSITKRDNKN